MNHNSKTVWVLYDRDDGVYGVYSSPELAAEAAKRFGLGVQPSPCQVDQMPELLDGKYGWCVYLENNGSAHLTCNVNVEEFKAESWRTIDDKFAVRCLAETEQQAIAIARDFMAKET